MIYYSKKLDNTKVIVRNMELSDAQIIADAEVAQGWINATPDKYIMRVEHQAQGKSVALVAEYGSDVAGYINVYTNPDGGAFAGRGFPEIVDFGVLEKYRNRGIGTVLMNTAEQIAASFSDTVCLGVGLHSGYGAAQRMYIKRGYIPDGSGVWYNDSVCKPYSNCCNDDGLILYLSKKLR